MQVYKFGGASINTIKRIQHTGDIIREQQVTQGGKLFLVVSAIGKTTNALEEVATQFFAGNKESALALFEKIKQDHLAIASQMVSIQLNACQAQLSDIFTEAEWLLHDRPVRGYDYYYDQIICTGELMSTVIIHHYLNETGQPNEWLDVRDIIRTDDNFRDANIDWAFTKQAVEKITGFDVASAAFQKSGQTENDNTLTIVGTGQPQNENNETGIFITQGFIGATADNESTTLGREGSDFTAAIFANLLNAESVTIWKDVASVMNADPKLFPEAQSIAET